jgi:hypothetical protein
MTLPSTKLTLSARGMANIAPSQTQNAFTFIVGNYAYRCPWFVAAFLSPQIVRLHLTDPTVSEFVIKTKDRDREFKSIISAGRGRSVVVTERTYRVLASVASELGNLELYFAIHNLIHPTVAISTFVEHFKDCEFVDHFPEEAIEFLSDHLFEFDKSFLAGLPISLLSQIFGHPSLRIESEDSLFDFVISQIESKGSHSGLLEFVRFEYLTKSTIERFVALSSTHFDELEMTRSLWQAIANRLSAVVTVAIPQLQRYPNAFRLGDQTGGAKQFRPQEGAPLDGIIAELTRTHGGNVLAQRIVGVLSSSSSASHPAENAADLDQENFFHSNDAPDQWLRYDFRDRRIELTHYSIAAHKDNWFLRSWVVEGSDDGLHWITLDEKTDDTLANSHNLVATFAVDRRMKCRTIRLRQTAKCARGFDILVIVAFEVFGLITA